jgi:hypothetical protein
MHKSSGLGRLRTSAGLLFGSAAQERVHERAAARRSMVYIWSTQSGGWRARRVVTWRVSQGERPDSLAGATTTAEATCSPVTSKPWFARKGDFSPSCLAVCMRMFALKYGQPGVLTRVMGKHSICLPQETGNSRPFLRPAARLSRRYHEEGALLTVQDDVAAPPGPPALIRQAWSLKGPRWGPSSKLLQSGFRRCVVASRRGGCLRHRKQRWRWRLAPCTSQPTSCTGRISVTPATPWIRCTSAHRESKRGSYCGYTLR